MASEQQVKQYLAHWFQLGRRVFGPQDTVLCPSLVIAGDRYSAAFEACWQTIAQQGGQDFYLEGTIQTIAELLTPAWEVERCSRCPMLVPMRVGGMPTGWCPCSEIPSWPNFDVPQPRLPGNHRRHLSHIHARVQQPEHQSENAIATHYPLPQSIALRTAIELHLAKMRGEVVAIPEAAAELLQTLEIDPADLTVSAPQS